MKFGKLFLCTLAAASLFVGCKEKEDFGLAELKIDTPSHEFAEDGGEFSFNIKATRDWTARVEPATEGVTVTPSSGSASNNPIQITVVAEKNTGKTRTFDVVFSASEVKDAKITFTQAGAAGLSIADLENKQKGDAFAVQGLVVAVHQKGCIIEDETGRAYIFDSKSDKEYAEVGTTVKVDGEVDEYNGMKQIIPSEGKTFVTKTDAEVVDVKFPDNATVITKDNHGSIEWTSMTPVQMEGLLSITDGKYFNINFGAADATGSISYPIESLGLNEMNGNNVLVKGYAVGTASNGKFLNILVVSVEDKGAPEIKTSTIEEVYAESVAVGTTVSIQGTVVGLHQRGFMVKDATGVIYVYEGSSVSEHLAAVGNNVTIMATKDKPFDSYQLKSATVTENDNSTAEPDRGTPEDITETIDTKDFTKSYYVSVSGVMGSDGRNITVAGKEYKAQINYALAEDEEFFKTLSGKQVTLTGYSISRNTTSKNVQIVAVEVMSEPYLNAVTSTVSVNSDATSASIDIQSNIASWTVACEADWITDYTKSGSNNGTISVSFDANSGEERSATFTVSADGVEPVTVTLTQKASGEQVVSYMIMFGPDYNEKKISTYENTWTVTYDSFVCTMTNWNNNNNQWTYVRAGRKGTASVATIATKNVIPEAIATVTVTVDDITAANLNSNKLEVATDDAFTNIISTVDNVEVSAGNVVYSIPTPTENCYYRLTYDFASGTKNGLIQVSKVVFTN